MYRFTIGLLPLLILLLQIIIPSNLIAQNLSTAEVQAWEEDINLVLEKLWQVYPDAEERLNKDVIQNAAGQLKEDLPNLSHEEAIIRLQALLALTGEGSNGIYPFQDALNYDMLPIKAYWFADGLFVCDAKSPYEHLIGEQIVAVNDVSLDVLWSKLRELLSGDNDQQKRGSATYTWQIAPWLAYLTETALGADATISLGNGQSETVAFQPNSSYLELVRKLPSYRSTPMSGQSHPNENYWMEYLPEQRTLFIQFLAIRDNADGPKFKAFVQQIADQLDQGNVDKVVIDNRYGGGGNGFKLKPLTDLLRDNENINQRGRLFVFTGRGTRGTVQELTSILELNTKAIFIGEPTGEGPNGVGDIKAVTLPNSGVNVWLVHTFWPTSWPEDPRETIQPEIGIEYSWPAYEAQEDPWFNAVLNYSEEPSTAVNASWTLRPGKYSAGDNTVAIEEIGGRYYLNLKRKLKSFFEIRTELHALSDERYATDIADVYLEATQDTDRLLLNWKGVSIELRK